MDLSFTAIRRKDIAQHRAWVTRGHAIGMGAGTQLLTHLPWILISGKPGVLCRALLMGAGWVINVFVAEWIIRGWRPADIKAPMGSFQTADETRLQTYWGSRNPRAERLR